MFLLGILDFLFVSHAYHSILTRGASVQLVFGFEVKLAWEVGRTSPPNVPSISQQTLTEHLFWSQACAGHQGAPISQSQLPPSTHRHPGAGEAQRGTCGGAVLTWRSGRASCTWTPGGAGLDSGKELA